MTKLYVGNLSFNTSDESLRAHFCDYGLVIDAVVMRDRDTGRTRGFGFVTFSNQQEADAALNGMNDMDLDGRRAKVMLASARGGMAGGPGQGYSSQGTYTAAGGF